MKSLCGRTLIMSLASLLVVQVVHSATPSKKPLLTRIYPSPATVTTPAVSTAAPAKVVSKGPSESEIRARHSHALDKALAGDTKSALSALNRLVNESSITPGERDRVYLSIGRISYQLQDDQGAIDAYQHVRKGSSSWLEALEERAWAYMRTGQPEMALASLKTVISPLFQDQIRTEPFFLTAYAQLRVCDYPSLFKTMDLFKQRFLGKVKLWEGSKDLDSTLRLQEASATIQKLNLVEAEAIQRLYIDESGKRMGGSVPGIAKNRDQLSFPEADGDEVWLDEVDDYHVAVKGCPAVQIAKKEKMP